MPASGTACSLYRSFRLWSDPLERQARPAADARRSHDSVMRDGHLPAQSLDVDELWAAQRDLTNVPFPGRGRIISLGLPLSAGGTITVPTDGVTRTWCWSGVPTNTTLHFHYFSTGNSGGDIAKASGSGSVHY
jgi:hypothetical protein